MQPLPNNEQSIKKENLKNSSFGITSFALTMIGDFFLLLAAIANSKNASSGPNILGIVYFLFIVPATVMAIYDLTKQNRKKALSKASLILGIGIIPILLIVSIISLALYVGIGGK